MSMLDDEWQSDFSLDRASWVQPSPPITSLGQQVGQGGICHPDEDRLFTIGELGRLMGLPDDYSMSGTWNQKAKTIGNMVPPVLMSAIAKSLYENVILPFRHNPQITYITAKSDYGERETLDRWKGQFLDEDDLDELVHIDRDTVILRPDPILKGSGAPIAYVVTNAFSDDSMREVLYRINQSSNMRANCAGPIDHEEMKKNGLIEGEDYKLRTPNSYFRRKKNGARIAALHLYEARRLIESNQEPQSILDACTLWDWLLKRGKIEFTRTELAKDVPHGLRETKKRKAAIAVLCERDYAREKKQGKATVLQINPKALK